MKKLSILFVCLGNICRSPLAEAAFRAEAQRLNLDVEIDSAGTGNWHVGGPPDPRACAAARRHGVEIDHLRARQVTADDFRRFTHILAMDHDNLAVLRRLAPADATAQLGLLMDHGEGRKGRAVADPYWLDDAAFDTTWADVAEAARGLAGALAHSDG